MFVYKEHLTCFLYSSFIKIVNHTMLHRFNKKKLRHLKKLKYLSQKRKDSVLPLDVLILFTA